MRLSFFVVFFLHPSHPKEVTGNAKKDGQQSSRGFHRPVHIIKNHQYQARNQKKHRDKWVSPRFDCRLFSHFSFACPEYSQNSQPKKNIQMIYNNLLKRKNQSLQYAMVFKQLLKWAYCQVFIGIIKTKL